MATTSCTVAKLGDDPFVITGRAIARHALGDMLFDDPGATRRWMTRGATPLLIRSKRGFAVHLVSSGQPMACLLPWDTPVARDPLFVGPEPDAVVTDVQAWDRMRWKGERAREHAVWLTPQETLAHINRMETGDGSRLTRQVVREPEILRLQLRVAFQDAADMKIREKDLLKLLTHDDHSVRAWAMRRLPGLPDPLFSTG